MSTELVLEVPGRVRYRNLCSGERGSGVELFEAEILCKDIGPAMHLHRHSEEIFYVVEGEMRFFIGEEERILTPFESLVVPRNTPHAWLSEYDGTSRMVFGFSPAGQMWAYLTDLTNLLNEGAVDFQERLDELCSRYDQVRVAPTTPMAHSVEKY